MDVGFLWHGISAVESVSVPNHASPTITETLGTLSEIKKSENPISRVGCSAIACHGGPAESELLGNKPTKSAWQSSSAVWLARDPHVHAAEALRSELAIAMMRRLKASEPAKWESDPLREIRCLACHTTPSMIVAANQANESRLLSEGVGCESCHGNAQKWVIDHSAFNAINRDREYRSRGMTRLYDLGERATTCLGCHVGAPEDPSGNIPLRDMNHEMIAAGHPRLNFEFADHLRRLPPHWFEKDRLADPAVARIPSFEAKAWLIGRVAFAEASLTLLADRAVRAGRQEADWPEWSDRKCFSCHRELKSGSDRYSGWDKEVNFNLGWPLNRIADSKHLGDDFTLFELKLRLLQKQYQRREPDTNLVAKAAIDARIELQRIRDDLSAMKDGEAESKIRIFYQSARPVARDWDDACQISLGLASLEWVKIRRNERIELKETPSMNTAFEILTLSREKNKDHFDSPKNFQIKIFQQELMRFYDSLSADSPKGKTR